MDNPSIRLTKISTLSIIMLLALSCLLVLHTTPASAQGQISVTVRVEKPDKPLCQETVTLTGGFTKDGKNFNEPCPLEALDRAAASGGFTYTATWYATSTPQDYFITNITVGGDSISNIGYCVSGVWPAYGVGYGWINCCPDLQDGDEIVFYDVGAGWVFPSKILKINVDNTEILREDSITITAYEANILWQQFKTSPPYDNPWPNVSWTASQGAKVFVDGQYAGITTDSNGKATISGLSLGIHEIYVEKSNSIRSARVSVTVNAYAGYSETQIEALNTAKSVVSSSGNVVEAYELLVENSIISSSLPAFSPSLYEKLTEIYGPNLERYPTFEGRIQLLYSMGIETLS